MLTRSLLDPRHFRIDDLLRQSYTDSACFGSSGPHLSAAHPGGWGLANGLRWNGSGDFGVFGLRIEADGETIWPAEAISRPSHLTLHGVSSDGVQVTEDKFITDRDVAVSVVSIRNAGVYDADVHLDLTWLLSEGEQTLESRSVWALRDAPPGDDRHIRLPTQSYRILTFLTALGHDRDAARRAAWSVFDVEEPGFPRRLAHYALPDTNPLVAHVRRFQQWFDRHMPRFDCPDPWLMQLWYHGWHQQHRLNLSPAQAELPTDASLHHASAQAAQAHIQAAFVGGDFNRLPCDERSAAWPTVIQSDILGIQHDNNRIIVRPSPLAASWDYFCLEHFRIGDTPLTLVWDVPTTATDAYDDGDKGLTLYQGAVPVYHADTLTSFELALTPAEESIYRL